VEEEFKLGCRTVNKREWGGKADGNYNVQAGYKWYMNSMMKPKWARVVWSKQSLPRHSFFAWLLMKHKLPGEADWLGLQRSQTRALSVI